MKLVPRPEGFLIVAETPEDGWHLGRLWENKQGESSLLQTAKYNDDHNQDLPCISVKTAQLVAVDEALRWQGTGTGRIGRIEELIQTEAKWLGSQPIDLEEMKANAPAEDVVPFHGNLLEEPDGKA